MRWMRIKALIIKEFLALLRDPRGRSILIGPPIVQLFVFAYAATLEVTNVDIMVLNRDAGSWGQELLHRIEGAPTFRTVTHAQHPDAVREAIDTQQVIAAVQIGPSFSRDIEAGLPTDIEVILDGRKSDASRLSAATSMRSSRVWPPIRKPANARRRQRSISFPAIGSIRT